MNCEIFLLLLNEDDLDTPPPPPPLIERVTEIGTPRITEDGKIRILE